ncbi:uncharacterized protein LOC143274609 [Babylonia areolata]|uniref:uncharacterized protein LOC143274609 n=1 Tax=Babylonia areolata TaxID=304850 RepID=UPI003FD51244
MAPVKIKFVVSFSSQDKIHKASNLLVENSGTKRWLTDPQDRTGQIDATFQLDRPCHLSYIDIGVIWCASVEVRVGKSDWPQGRSYVTLVPTQVLMSPVDSRLSRNVSRTCMFSKAHFTKEVASDSSPWDRIQVVGRQPWRKDVQLGLSFIRVSCSDSFDSAADSCRQSTDSGNKTGKTLSVAAMEEYFFGNKKKEKEDTELKSRLQKIAATAEGVTANPSVLSRNARMVLLANQNSSKSESPDEDTSCQNCASTDGPKEQTIDRVEVTRFLGTLSIEKGDIESLKVSDLRHKFEKLKWRKLTVDEKRTFYNCCQDFIGRLFDDDDDAHDDFTAVSASTNNAAFSEHSPCRSNKNNNTVDKGGDVSKTSSSSHHKLLSRDAKNQERERTTPKSSAGRASNTTKISSDGKSPRSDQKLSGGFLNTVFSLTDDGRGRGRVTANNSTSPPQADRDHNTDVTSRPGQHVWGHASSTPTQRHSKKSVSSLAKQNISYRLNTAAKQDRNLESEDSYFCADKPNAESNDIMMSPKHSSAESNRCSPEQSRSALTTRIDRSLLNTHRQFVKGRLDNIVSRSAKPGQSAAAAVDASIDPEPSEQTDTPAQSLSRASRRRNIPSGKGPQLSGKKRQGALLGLSENFNPAKQRPKFCSTPRGGDTSGEEEEDGGWLNAKRDAGRSQARGEGDSSTKQRQAGRSMSALRTEEVKDSPSSRLSAGSGGQGNKLGRGLGPGAARRRLEMPEEDAATSTSRTSPTPEASTTSMTHSPAPASDSDDPFRGELQIAEVATFVECPLCEEMFPEDTVNTHAADCPGKQSVGVAGAGGVRFVPCPLCEDLFSEDVIEDHASRCCL